MKQTIKTMLTIAALAAAASGQAADLQVKVENLKSANGKVLLSLYNNADSYLKTPVHVAEAAASQGQTVVVFKNVPAGDYALSGYHDENSNGKIDIGAMGIPAEPYAFGNDASGAMGPPAFDKARVSVPAAGASTTLTMR